MFKKSFALQLDGEVTLGRFQEALSAWHSTLEAISHEVDGEQPRPMLLSDLSYGSAIAAVQAEFERESSAARFVEQFDIVASKVRGNDVEGLPQRLRKPAARLQEAAKLDSGEGFTLSSDDADYMISGSRMSDDRKSARPAVDTLEAYGAVIGKLQSLSSRGSLRAVIFDELNDKAVRVALTDEQHETVRDLWDKPVVVEGLVRRDPDTGRPLSMSRIRRIYRKEEPRDPFAWRKARGVLAHIHPEKRAEQLIREARDA